MSTNTISVEAPPGVVWSVLADPPTYEYWVVGNKAIRSYDGQWPAPNSAFHHKVGFGPITIADKSVALEADAPRRLKMQVRAWPVGTGIVTFELEPEGGGQTKIVMGEAAEKGPAKMLAPVLDRLTWLRNAETLRRLKRCAEERHRAGTVGT
jgi:uncharacterized protein YndB with AHSA1/START domain